MRQLVKRGLSARMTGDGIVVEQQPEAGTLVEAREVRLVLERPAGPPQTDRAQP
jgi:hypothetical protein